jgi:hypothetical protein
MILYRRYHRAVRIRYGSAREYGCWFCDNQAEAWAWIDNTDPEDTDNYIPMCVNCIIKLPFRDDFGPLKSRRKCPNGCRCNRHNNPNTGAPRKEKPGVIAQHDRVRLARGWADEFYCYGCGGDARDWANVHGTDRLDIKQYVPLCRRCHIIYDGIRGYDFDTIMECLKNSNWRERAMSNIMRRMREGGGRSGIR